MTNLEYFEPLAQYKVVRAIMEDAELFKKISNIIDNNAFEDKNLRIIVGIISDYFKKNGYVPSYSALQIELLSKITTDREEALKTLALIQGASLEGISSINEMAIKFFRLKYLVNMANRVLDRVKAGDDQGQILKQAYGNINKLMTSEIEGTVTTIITKEGIRDIIQRNENESVVPTGIEEIDCRLGGGLGRCEIGLFVAPTGYGKTTAGTIFANNAARNGYNVLQIYFEDKPEDIVRKHLACSTGEMVNNFKFLTEEEADERMEKIGDETIQMMEKHLILSKMKDGQTTVEDIEQQINKYMNVYGFRPDLIIIDYFSSLKHSTNPSKNSWDAQASAMRKIKEIAFKYNSAIWVLQQTNRSGVSKEGDSSGMGNIQGAFEATQPVSVWLTLQRTKEQRKNFRADIIFNKTRHSMPKDDLINIKFDNSTLQIDCKDNYDELAWNDDFKFNNNGEKF